MLKFIPWGPVYLERIPQGTYSKIWVTTGTRGIAIFTFKAKARDRGRSDVTNFGWTNARSRGSTTALLKLESFPAVEKFLPERGHAVLRRTIRLVISPPRARP